MKLLALTKSSTRSMKERKAQMARDEDTTERGGAYVIHQVRGFSTSFIVVSLFQAHAVKLSAPIIIRRRAACASRLSHLSSVPLCQRRDASAVVNLLLSRASHSSLSQILTPRPITSHYTHSTHIQSRCDCEVSLSSSCHSLTQRIL